VAQWGAMICNKNKQLNHNPPSTWKCYSAKAAYACNQSNLANRGTDGSTNPDFITQYVEDAGDNNKMVGHRVWIFYNTLKYIGLGNFTSLTKTTATNTNTFYVNNSFRFKTAKSVTRNNSISWPIEGYNPYNIVFPRWSFSYIGGDLSKATIKVNGVAKQDIFKGAVLDTSVIVWEMPTQTKPIADQTYEVIISNIKVGNETKLVTYIVVVIDPVK
jgi:hypothetical protein